MTHDVHGELVILAEVGVGSTGGTLRRVRQRLDDIKEGSLHIVELVDRVDGGLQIGRVQLVRHHLQNGDHVGRRQAGGHGLGALALGRGVCGIEVKKPSRIQTQ